MWSTTFDCVTEVRDWRQHFARRAALRTRYWLDATIDAAMVESVRDGEVQRRTKAAYPR